ncbi:MAG TPA: sigma-70 family RNA polymerase sigma factor [Candidatus Binatia bacterium]|nr:sigma-70 family RNA polymerase sigma factor [Candidatus Binatia bacterium]
MPARVGPVVAASEATDSQATTGDRGVQLGPEATADRVVLRLDQADGRSLHGFVVRMGLSPDEADDAVQEVLLRLWATIRSGRTIDDPRAWAFRSIYRLAMDAHRWRRRVDGIRDRLRRDPSRAVTLDPDHSRTLSIWIEVDRLPPRQREILYLRYRADMTFDEAAAVMGITAGAARANATKAMTSLRRSVGSREAW